LHCRSWVIHRLPDEFLSLTHCGAKRTFNVILIHLIPSLKPSPQASINEGRGNWFQECVERRQYRNRQSEAGSTGAKCHGVIFHAETRRMVSSPSGGGSQTSKSVDDSTILNASAWPGSVPQSKLVGFRRLSAASTTENG
jgi:hypothetical protein